MTKTNQTQISKTNSAFSKRVAGDSQTGYSKTPELFDVIVGNPPYVRVKKEDYPMYQWNTDLYLMFFERVLKHGLLKKNGYLGFIVPRYWMVNKENKDFRHFLLTQVDIISLSETSPFEDAETENVVVIIKNSPKENDKIEIRVDVDKKFIHKGYIKVSDCLKNENYEILTHITEADKILIAKMEKNTVLLKTISKSKRGAEVGKDFLRSNQGMKSLIGQDVNRYSIEFENTFLPENHKENIRLNETFSNSQIFLRRVANRLIATARIEKFAFNKNIYGIWIDKKLDYKFILACLNSDILSWYYKTKFSTKKVDIFPEIQAYLYEQLPIPKATTEQQTQIAELVDRIMELKKEVSDINSKTIRTIEREYQPKNLTKKLQEFYKLDFGEFIQELEKQKVKLTLAKKEELEEYFEERKTKFLELQSRVEKVDGEIEELVRGFYGVE
jgi:adenine-specific DNA-methyltransferase